MYYSQLGVFDTNILFKIEQRLNKMAEASPYHDKRSDFFKEYFSAALPYDDYLKTGEEKHRARWEAISQKIVLGDRDRRRVSAFTRKINVLVMSGIWCGDCVRQGPMLKAIEDASSVMTFRYIDNRQNPDLLNELRINGAEKVPVVVALSEDFFELSRFGDRHLSVYRRKVEAELGPACDAGLVPAETNELSVELTEWVDFFERLQHMLRLAPALRRRYGD